MSALASFIADFFNNYAVKFLNVLIDIAQSTYNALCGFILTVVSWFPAGPTLPNNAPAAVSGSLVGHILNCVNWVFPVCYLTTMLVFLCSAMVAYFVIAPVARWFKLLT